MFKAVVSIYVTSEFKECLTLNICHNRNGKKKELWILFVFKIILKKKIFKSSFKLINEQVN